MVFERSMMQAITQTVTKATKATIKIARDAEDPVKMQEQHNKHQERLVTY